MKKHRIKIPKYLQEVIDNNIRRYSKKEKVFLHGNSKTIYEMGFLDSILFQNGFTVGQLEEKLKERNEEEKKKENN